MRRRTLFLTLLALLAALVLRPAPALACQLTDPSCYIEDFSWRQLYELALWLWQFNRAALVLARWLEDLRGWLIEAVLVDAFTTLTEPIRFLFVLGLIVAWLLFVISYLVQSLIDLRWVDLRRALRPIVLALFVFSAGGSVLKGSEEVRVLGGSLLQQTALATVASVDAPRIPTEQTGDLPDATTSIYTDGTACGTPARTIPALELNDYSARYLWSDAEDIHCAAAEALPGAFRSHYFSQASIADQSDANVRQKAVGQASQGVLRQLTGLWLTAGAVIQQLIELLYALALALIWFSLLLSLVTALFVPTEALFSGQLKALLAVLRASWLASFLIGLGLALLQLVAVSGNGLLLYLCGLALIAVCLWQGKQALGTLSTALDALGASAGGAPQAVGGMVRGWATTAAVVGGVVATGGGLGAALGQVSSTMVRRAGRNVGDNPVAQAAGRVLSNRIADGIDGRLTDARGAQDAAQYSAEAAWYERKEYDGAGTPEADSAAAQQQAAAAARARAEQARVLERRAERARQAGNFGTADRLRRQAAELRDGTGPAGAAGDATGTPEREAATERALEQLHEAQDDPEMQRRVLHELLAEVQRAAAGSAGQEAQPESLVAGHRTAALKAARNRALREKRFDDAKAAIRALREQEATAVVGTLAGDARAAPTSSTPARSTSASSTPSAPLSALESEIGALAEQIGALEQQLPRAGAEARAIIAATLVPLWGRLAAAQKAHAAIQPTDAALLTEVTTPGGSRPAGQPIAIARTAGGLMVDGRAVTDSGLRADGQRFLVTEDGVITLAAADGVRVQTLPLGQALRVPVVAPDVSSAAAPDATHSAAPGDVARAVSAGPAVSSPSTHANGRGSSSGSYVTPATTISPPGATFSAAPPLPASAAPVAVPPPVPFVATPPAPSVAAAPAPEIAPAVAPAASAVPVTAAPEIAPVVAPVAPAMTVAAPVAPAVPVVTPPAASAPVSSPVVASVSPAPATTSTSAPAAPAAQSIRPRAADLALPSVPEVPPALSTPAPAAPPAVPLQPWKRGRDTRGPS